ncbi:MFS transporter [Aquipuribacter sp. SD81]|uniref:MFS transporter n=1 Tax=Aquipuribacter sp. SD81 TaxID=3127703 RepID=UPI003018F137
MSGTRASGASQPPDAPGGAPGLPAPVWVLAAVAFVVALGFGIVVPAIALFADSFGVGRTAVGLAVSAFAFFRLVTGPLGGRLVTRWGERPVLVAGCLTVAVTSGVAGFAPSFPVFVLLRAAGGVGSAAFTIAAVTLLLRVAPERARARATATFQGGFLLGGMVGPAFGGLLTDVAVWLPFVTYGTTLVVAALVARLGLPSPPPQEQAAAAAAVPLPERLAAARRLLLHPVLAVALVANLGVGWMLFGVRNSLVTLYVVDLGGSATLAGVVLLLGAVAQGVTLRLAGGLADTRGRRPALLLGSWLGAGFVGLLAVPVTGTVGLVLAAVGMAGFGVGAAFLASAPGALVADVGRTGGRVAALQMASDLGAVVGPLAAGALADASGYPLAFAVSAVVVGVAGVAALRMPETAPDVVARTR